MLDEMRPKDKIPQDALSESDLTKLLNGVYAEMEELVFKFYTDNQTGRAGSRQKRRPSSGKTYLSGYSYRSK